MAHTFLLCRACTTLNHTDASVLDVSACVALALVWFSEGFFLSSMVSHFIVAQFGRQIICSRPFSPHRLLS
jgi:hypothetical protein